MAGISVPMNAETSGLSILKEALLHLAKACRLSGFSIITRHVDGRPEDAVEPASQWTVSGVPATAFDDPVIRLGLDLQMRRVGREGGTALEGPSIIRTGQAVILSYALAIAGTEVFGIHAHFDDDACDLTERVQQCDAELTALTRHVDLAVRPLSHRELEVARWLAEGKTSHEVGIILSLSEHTVNEYIRTAMRKLGSTNRLQFVAKSIRLGLVG